MSESAAIGEETAARLLESCRTWTGHVIVCGMQDVALRAVSQLQLAGAQVVVITDRHADERLLRSLHRHDVPTVARTAYLSDSLAEAGISGAVGVICVDASDLQTFPTCRDATDTDTPASHPTSRRRAQSRTDP